MGKKKITKHNDFLDGEKLTDNTEIRATLQQNTPPTTRQPISPPPPTRSVVQTNDAQSTNNAAKRPPLTHFLCLPLTTSSTKQRLQTGLEELKTHLQDQDIVSTKAIRPVGTLHLTLGVMSLDAQTLSAAITHFNSLSLHTILRDISHTHLAQTAAENGTVCENLNAAGLEAQMPSPNHITVDLKGLVAMQDPSKTSILYARPDDSSNRLLPFAQHLKTGFEKAELMVKEDRDLKLHATIINTIYAKSKSKSRNQGHGPNAKGSGRFDARDLIERYKDFVWVENVRIDRVMICKMGAKKVWSGGLEGEGEVVDEEYEVVCEKMIGE